MATLTRSDIVAVCVIVGIAIMALLACVYALRTTVQTADNFLASRLVSKPTGTGTDTDLSITPFDKANEYRQLLDFIWWMESRCGTDPACAVPGDAGEIGEYQITPIFIEDVERIERYTILPWDNRSCRFGITLWLQHYSIGLGISDQPFELYKMYNMGPQGYKKYLVSIR